MLGGIFFAVFAPADSPDTDTSAVKVIKHEWRPDTVWEKIGSTKYIWKATLHNNSDKELKVSVFFVLLNKNDSPLARNMAQKQIGPRQTLEVVSDSYIRTSVLPKVHSSQISVKVDHSN